MASLRKAPLSRDRQWGFGALVGRLLTGVLLDRWFAPCVSFGLILLATAGTWLLSGAHSVFAGVASALCIGIGMDGEADVTPFLLSKYFGLRSFLVLYGFSWTTFAIAGAVGPVIMGKAFDVTGSYAALLWRLALLTLLAGCLMLLVPRCGARERSELPMLPDVVRASSGSATEAVASHRAGSRKQRQQRMVDGTVGSGTRRSEPT